MDTHTRKTLEAITTGRAPRDLSWHDFEALWNDVADGVETESGDRLAVTMNGRRVVFHRPHDGRVAIGDIEHARQLLRDHAHPQGHGSLVAVAIDDESARILEFDLDTQGTAERQETVRNPDRRARRMRTVERRGGRDDEHTLVGFLDDVAHELIEQTHAAPFVVLGHGSGKSNAAQQFAERVRSHFPQLAKVMGGVGTVDLGSATDADLEAAAFAARS